MQTAAAFLAYQLSSAKTFDRVNVHESRCKWRKASCAPAQKRLVEGLSLCEAELSCFGPESLGGVTSAPS